MTKEYLLCSKTLWDEINRDFNDKGGIYFLYYKYQEQVQSVGRFLGVDHDGILYIGKATKFLNRVIDLKKTLDPSYKSETHICGRRYNKNENIKNAFPYSNLFVKLSEHEKPEIKEKESLNEYFIKFGEVPPLNAY